MREEPFLSEPSNSQCLFISFIIDACHFTFATCRCFSSLIFIFITVVTIFLLITDISYWCHYFLDISYCHYIIAFDAFIIIYFSLLRHFIYLFRYFRHFDIYWLITPLRHYWLFHWYLYHWLDILLMAFSWHYWHYWYFIGCFDFHIFSFISHLLSLSFILHWFSLIDYFFIIFIAIDYWLNTIWAYVIFSFIGFSDRLSHFLSLHFEYQDYLLRLLLDNIFIALLLLPLMIDSLNIISFSAIGFMYIFIDIEADYIDASFIFHYCFLITISLIYFYHFHYFSDIVTFLSLLFSFSLAIFFHWAFISH